jgi:cytochrome c oxidase assembly factor 2
VPGPNNASSRLLVTTFALKMPPILHPKSPQTLSLFTTTLALAFGVVTLPHVFPCPVDHRRKMYADGETPERRRMRKMANAGSTASDNSASDATQHTDIFARDPSKRECPVPKPTGLIGQLLGFRESSAQRENVKVEIANPNERR